MKTIIAIIPTSIDRRDIESYEGTHFNSIQQLNDFLETTFKVQCFTESLGEFTTRINDEDYPTDAWVAYFYIN